MEKDPIKTVLTSSKIPSLNPVQESAVDAGLLEKKNMVVAAPTASGKTLVAEIAMLNTVFSGKKVVYIVPLRALANEKYEDFKKKYESLGIKIAISVGDMDSNDSWLERYDIIICTSEKLDSLLRHNVLWMNEVGLVIADEVHLLNDPGRGPTLEIILTRLRTMQHEPTILALSATINNYEELARWLDATPVKSDYRSVKLYTGIFFEEKLSLLPKREYEFKKTDITHLVHDTLEKKKQALVFISTRKGTESFAEKIGALIQNTLTAEEKKKLNDLAEKITGSLEHTTVQCKRLAGCIKTGTAFHHAGLTNKQRSLIENAFREGIIKVITATPTLAAGLNLPAYRVIVRDLKRFHSYKGMDYLPVLEIHQMLGRAGRPAYDSEGEGVLVPKNHGEASYAWDNYVNGETERIYSKLGVEPVLRTHTLALIASGMTPTKKELIDFFSKTFYAFQFEDMNLITKHIEKILLMLEEYGLIVKTKEDDFQSAQYFFEVENEKLQPTKLGKRVSELYIDPITAHHLIVNLKKMDGEGCSFFGFLHMIASSMEMKPLPNVRKADMAKLNATLIENEKNLLVLPPNEWDIDYDDFLKAIKAAKLFVDWCEEKGEDYMLETFNVSPGELRARLDILDWLLYSTAEIAQLLGYKDILKEIRRSRLRLKYGVREELLPFVKLKGVGRVRARTLFASGVHSLSDLRKTPLERLKQILTPKIALSIKDQLGQED